VYDMNGCKASQDGQHVTGEIKEWSDENTNFVLHYCASCGIIILIDSSDKQS